MAVENPTPETEANEPAAPSGVLRWLVVAIAALALLGVGFAAGRLTFTAPSTSPEATDEQVLVEVSEGTIGQTLDYGGRTARSLAPIATNSLSGTVTDVPQAGVAERKTGDVLFRVDGTAVRIVQGKTPFYRALAAGSVGEDVAQLEAALVELGHLDAADSIFDEATTRAVAAWQQQLGMQPTGTVALGELIAAPSLPASVSLDGKAIWVGARLNGGEVAVSMGSGVPEFTLPLSPGQLSLVPPGATMTVEGFGKSWPARWESSQQNQDLGVGEVVRLSSPDGGPVCADDCDVVPAEPGWVTVHIEVVPQTSGPTVPVSAVSTDASGQVWVSVEENGVLVKREVSVVRAHGGLAVVDGVRAGERVQALAEAPDDPSAQSAPSDPETGPGDPQASETP